MLTREEREYLDQKYCLRSGGLENRLLTAVMRNIRKKRKILDHSNLFSVFKTADLCMIWLHTPACRFSQEGKCTICNYWAGQKIPGVVDKMTHSVSVPEDINMILINTCGSCLDTAELLIEEQEQLLEWLNQQRAENIILETHMYTLSEDTVKRVCRMLPNKNVFFEMGQESLDEDVLFYCLNKTLTDDSRKIVIDRICRYGAKSIINVVLGAPFLTREEQIADAIHSVMMLLQEGIGQVILFPINIKPATLPYVLYEMGMYAPVDMGMIAAVLDVIPVEYLHRVDVSWYGEHKEEGVIPPFIPEKDREEFIHQIALYNSSTSGTERKELVKSLVQKSRRWSIGKAEKLTGDSVISRIDKAYEILQRMYVVNCNSVLKSVMQRVFNERENFPVEYLSHMRQERVNDMLACQLWFISSGCSHENRGGCTMCNYGYGKGFTYRMEEILESIERDLEGIPNEIQEFSLGPTGSFLDEQEVKPELRREILSRFERVNCQNFYIETRIDTISREKLSELKYYIHAKQIIFEVGLECADNWVLRNCINKNLMVEELEPVVCLVHEYGMKICANIGIGIPFLSEYTGIDLAVQSIRKAFSLGVDEVVLFPYHIKPGTLLEVLYNAGLYKPTSLWSLIENLQNIPAETIPKVSIAWYKNYYGEDSNLIIASPGTCSACEQKVISLLDEYKNAPDRNTVEKMRQLSCMCRERWRAETVMPQQDEELENIMDIYRFLADQYHISKLELHSELEYMKNTWRGSA